MPQRYEKGIEPYQPFILLSLICKWVKSEVSFQTKYFVQKEIDIRGSRNALPEDFRAVINYMKSGNCPIEKLVSKVVSPENALNAMKEWLAAPGKVFRILVEF